MTPKASNRLPRLETRKLAERAKDALLASIAEGGFPDGHLPSEERLAEQLGVSRTTIREALRSLEEEGLVTRQQGVGTRVNDHVVRATSLNRIVGFYDLIRDAGYEPTIASTTVERRALSGDAARLLGRPEGSPVVAVQRLFLADGEPVVHLTETVPEAEIARPFEPDAFPDSIFEFAEQYCRTPIDHTVVEIVPIVADRRIAADLALTVGEPLLRLHETHYAADGTPFLTSLIHTHDRFLRFTVVRKRS